MAVGGCSQALVTIGVLATMGALGCGVMTNVLNTWYEFDATATVSGVDKQTVSLGLGLWKVCASASADGLKAAECTSIPIDGDSDNPDRWSAFNMIRGFDITSLILGLVAMILGIVGCCSPGSQVAGIILGVLQGGAMIGAVGKFAQDIDNSLATYQVVPGVSNGYGQAFYLSCASAGLAFVAVMFYGFARCAVKADQRMDDKVQLVQVVAHV